ncbi:MAG: hypothetical protein AVDCRST_MAG04-2122, partial [uncultured Acetobacteraceae bacterium]
CSATSWSARATSRVWAPSTTRRWPRSETSAGGKGKRTAGRSASAGQRRGPPCRPSSCRTPSTAGRRAPAMAVWQHSWRPRPTRCGRRTRPDSRPAAATGARRASGRTTGGATTAPTSETPRATSCTSSAAATRRAS